MGAAVHSGIMGGELQEVVLLDVTPHNMGVKVAGDRMSVVIQREHEHPDAREEGLRDHRGQPDVRRDRDLPGRARARVAATAGSAGSCSAISRRRRAARTKVEVSFTMDADGILEVTAAEVGTGRAASVTIEASSGLTPEEIKALGKRLAR